MSDVAMTGRQDEAPFRARTVALLLIVGVIGFAGFALLSAFAPDLRSGRNAGAHALSNAAIGYAGLVQLAQATGRNPRIIRNEHDWDTDDLVVATPETGAVDMTKFVVARHGRATLLVLPKWSADADKDKRGWVNIAGLVSADQPAGVLAPATRLNVARHRSGGRPLRPVNWAPHSLAVAAPRPVQTVASPGLEPLVTDETGAIVLGKLPDTTVYVLADPDLLDNAGIATLPRARAAMDLLDFLNSTGASGVAFDVTLNGLGGTRSPLKLAFEPPFLAMTLALLVVLALTAWQALIRFGAPEPRRRALAFGKAALVDNTALLLRKAGREGALGARYAEVIRERSHAIFAVPAHLRDGDVDRYLDRLDERHRFSDLAEAAGQATHRADMLLAAQALHEWQQEKTR